MADGIGTLAWAARTGGEMTFGEKLAQLADAVGFQLRVLPAQLRSQLGLGPGMRPALDPDTIAVPDSAIARAAEEHCRAVSPPWLVNHDLRSYLWGRVLGAQAGLAPDEELLYVACLLHDLGLTPAYAGGAGDPPCFAVRGARAARALVSDRGWSGERADRLAEAIAMHVNVAVALEAGTEAHLLNAATALDVGGLRYWELDPQTVAAVVARVPRLEMKQHIWPVWRTEANAHPRCRGHFLNRWLRFGARIWSAPFTE